MSVDWDYLKHLDNIYHTGEDQSDRTSVGSSRQLFDQSIKFDTEGCKVPFVQCRTFSPKLAFLEWKWMMSGSTDSKWLEERGVNIWKGNTSREFLDSRVLHHLPEGDVGKSYGYQFRNFGGVDQIKKVFESLRDNPTGRRHVISIYNVGELDEAPLEPCSFLYEFMYQNGKVHLYQHMRSQDALFGSPYNMAFGNYLLFSFCEALGYTPGNYTLHGTNCHIYENQMSIVKEMLDFDCYEYRFPDWDVSTPTLSFKKPLKTLDDILSLEYDDLIIEDWVRGPVIGNAEMAV